MYSKDLTEDFRLRLSKTDMDFLRELSNARGCTISEVVRSILGEYRRNLDTVQVLRDALELAKKGVRLSNGDTKTDIDDLV